jgi:MFS family permease
LFFSGADSALIYDSLKQNKQEENFKKVLGNAKSFGYLAAGLSAIIGGFIASAINMRFNWILTSIGMFFLLFIVLTYNEPKHYEKIQKKSYWKHTLESFKEAFNNKDLLFLLLFYSFLAVIARTSLWFYQPYLKQSGWNIAYFGIIWASFTIFAIVGSKFSHRIERYFGNSKSLWLMILISTLSLIFMSQFLFLWGLLFIFCQQFLRGFNPPVLADYTNRHLSSEKRATLLSIQSFSGNLLFVIIGPIFGKIADLYTLSTALLLTGVIFFLAFVILMVWNKKRNTANP